MLHNVAIIGRLARGPELRYTAGSGTAWGTFTLALGRPYVNRKTGESEAVYIDVTAI